MMTRTSSTTYTRYSLIKLQVIDLLVNAANASKESLMKVEKGLYKQYISEVSVMGLYTNGDIGAEIRLNIDWREHKILILAGGDNLQIPSNWENGVAPTETMAIQTFLEACEMASLKREWVVAYDKQFNVDEVNEELGFVRAPAREWRHAPEQLPLNMGPLSEVKCTISLAID